MPRAANRSFRGTSDLAAELAELFRLLTKALFDPYRPERHYMRGPGPKWHAKHDPIVLPLDAPAIPALVRVKR
jgi:hypothetical protein